MRGSWQTSTAALTVFASHVVNAERPRVSATLVPVRTRRQSPEADDFVLVERTANYLLFGGGTHTSRKRTRSQWLCAIVWFAEHLRWRTTGEFLPLQRIRA
jgi:hypothetical protein